MAEAAVPGRSTAGPGLKVSSLAEELMPVVNEWRMLGRKLGLEEYELEIINREKPAEREKLVAVLDTWLRKRPDASWTDIFRALEIMSENTLVEEIGRKYSLTGSRTAPAVPCLPVKKLTETNHRKMKTKFFGLVGTISMTLNKKMSMELDEQRGEQTFKLFCLRVAGFCNASSLAEKKTVLEIFTTLRTMNYWDLEGDPYELLLGIVEVAGDEEITETVENYQQEYYTHYLVATRIADYIALRQTMEVIPTQPNLVNLSMKLGDLKVDESSLAYLTDLWKSVKRCVNLPDLYSILASVEDGCVYVTWLVPTHAISALTRLPELAPELLTKYGVISIYINGVCIYDVHAKMDTKEKPFDEDNDNDRDPTPQHQLPSPKPSSPELVGYDIELVHDTDDLHCPICLQVLRDPMQVKCCGKRFCQACIKHALSERKKCPHCNAIAGKFEVFKDKAQQQAILEAYVYCPNKKEGCHWAGEHCQLDKHLNFKNERCQYRIEECAHCSVHYTLCHGSNCPLQPYTCSYCKRYSSTYKSVTSDHFSVCREFPMQCRFCLKKMPRKNCQQHIMEFSGKPHPLGSQGSGIFQARRPSPVFIPPPNIIMTDFYYYCWYGHDYGINELWFSPPFYSHIGGYKMQLMVNAYYTEGDRNTYASMFVCLMRGEFDDDLTWPFRGEVTVRQLQRVNSEGTEDKILVCDNIAPDGEGSRVISGKHVPIGWGDQKFIMYDLDRISENVSLEFQITQIVTKELVPPVTIAFCAQGEDIISHPFYSHTEGYKMQLLVCAKGRGSGKDTHISVYIYLMRGEFDNSLSWPFQGKVRVQLVNQRGKNHILRTIAFNSTTSDEVAGRVTKSERALCGKGYDQFISHSALSFITNQDQYLKNNRMMQFQIAEVKLTGPASLKPEPEHDHFIVMSTPV